jgi:hypothetical protein
MVITLSATYMAVTMSSMLVIYPTCFFSSNWKWFRQVPQNMGTAGLGRFPERKINFDAW